MPTENKFIKHCHKIETESGIKIPENIKTYFSKFPENSDNFYFQSLKVANDYKIFYTREFVQFIINKYADCSPDPDFIHLQNILDEGNYEYSLLKKEFFFEGLDFSFLNNCLQEYNEVPFHIGVYIFETCGGEEFLIINGEKIGYIAGRNHLDFEVINHQNITIKYQKIDFIKKLKFT